MLPASASALLPVFLRSARPARHSRAFAAPWSPAAARGLCRQIICLFKIAYTFTNYDIWRARLLPAGAWLNGLTRLSEIERSQVRDSVDLFVIP